MTLIIGFRCKDGVALVSDTKFIDVETGEPSYSSKILAPLAQTPFIIGAAGYSDLFMEFNRKIPLIVRQRLNEFRIQNIKALIESGLTRNEAITYLRPLEQRVESTQQPINLEESHEVTHTHSEVMPIPLPYVYSYEHFLSDCKDVIKDISDRYDLTHPLDVLIGLQKGDGVRPSLHYIDYNGREHEVESYYQIGSGSPHVKLFFSRLWDFNKDIQDLISIAFFTIAYVRDIAKDNYVGYDENHTPEAIAVLNDGRYGRMPIENENNIFLDINNNINRFEEQITNLRIQ